MRDAFKGHMSLLANIGEFIMTNFITRPSAIISRPAFQSILNDFFANPDMHIRRSTNGYPVTDIYKDDSGNQIIEMALAGFSKDDIKIDIEDNTITIWSESFSDQTINKQRRIARRDFSKRFVDFENHLDLTSSKATFVNGLLEITIPPQKPKDKITIEIK